jgi:5-methylcytosine-specific restriction endonuclease McrA
MTEPTFEEQYAAMADGVRRRLGNPSCLMCGNDSDNAMEWIDAYNREVAGVLLCSKCCNMAWEAHERKHGGYSTGGDRGETSQKKKISGALSKAVFERDAYRCVRCTSHIDLTCDHIKPESKGGETTLENLQTMCRPCNSSKGTKET